MWTMSDTKLTTAIIIAVSPSTRKPTSIFRPPSTIHSYTVPLKRAPSTATDLSTIADRMKEMSTPRMVAVWAPRRPTALPKKPATMAPASGASGTHSSVDWERVEAMVVQPPWSRLKAAERPLGGQEQRDVGVVVI